MTRPGPGQKRSPVFPASNAAEEQCHGVSTKASLEVPVPLLLLLYLFYLDVNVPPPSGKGAAQPPQTLLVQAAVEGVTGAGVCQQEDSSARSLTRPIPWPPSRDEHTTDHIWQHHSEG